MKAFEVIDISGDAGIRAYGETMEELFINAATGMYSLITSLEDVGEQREIAVALESHSLEGLLVSWLNELIFHFDTYGFVGKKFLITEITPSVTLPPAERGSGQTQGSAPTYMLKGSVSGEDFDPERHERRLLIKAATYHQLSLEKREGQWVTNVIFDI
jgi:SHS2 domain-containing protein